MSGDDLDTHEVSETSRFINKDILRPHLCIRQQTSFRIGAEIFYEQPDASNNYIQFKIYAKKRSIDENVVIGNLSDEEYSSTSDSLSLEEMDQNSLEEGFLEFHLRELANGIIINSDVYIPRNYWHTIIFTESVAHCFVCDLYFTHRDVERHINDVKHNITLENCKPLAKYDLMITRKRKDLYHCGVCNDTFEAKAKTEHFNSKLHVEHYLYAINKVSDCTDDVFPTENDGRDDDEEESDDDDDSDNNDGIYDEEYDNEWVEALADNPGPSYANMLKKTKVVPKEYVIDLYNKKVHVTFDSYHMILTQKDNIFYCLACKNYYEGTKNQHCNSIDHLEKLINCPSVDCYKEYFIRKVGDLNHCGHCNSLQIPSGLEQHLERKHPLKQRKVSKNPNPNTNDDINRSEEVNNERNEDIDDDTPETIDKEPDKRVDNVNTEMNAAINSINVNNTGLINKYGNIVKKFLYSDISMSFFHYHTSKKDMNYYNYLCLLCNVTYPEEDLTSHVDSRKHIELIQMTPFLTEFGLNMMRHLHSIEQLHCAHCNTVHDRNTILDHIQSPNHKQLLRNSLSIDHNSIPSTSAASTSMCIDNNEEKPYVVETKPDLDDKKVNTANSSINNKIEVKTDVNVLQTKPETQNRGIEIKKAAAQLACEEKENVDNENSSLNESIESIIDLEELVFIKLDNVYLKITFTSYNTLVPLRDGDRHCFVCWSKVMFEEIKKHVESRSHMENISACKFINLYEGIPFRQMYLMFHCGICNVMMSRSNIKDHVVWSKHITNMESSKKIRKSEVKSGTQIFIVKTEKETLYEHAEESVPKTLFYYNVVDKDNGNSVKKYKMVSINEDIFKLPLDSWHGVVRTKQEIRCLLCQNKIENVEDHVNMQEHKMCIQYPFHKDHLGDLLREINNGNMHCLICNVEVANMSHVISKHVAGKRHKNNYQVIKEFSANAKSYSDCDDDMLEL